MFVFLYAATRRTCFTVTLYSIAFHWSPHFFAKSPLWPQRFCLRHEVFLDRPQQEVHRVHREESNFPRRLDHPKTESHLTTSANNLSRRQSLSSYRKMPFRLSSEPSRITMLHTVPIDFIFFYRSRAIHSLCILIRDNERKTHTHIHVCVLLLSLDDGFLLFVDTYMTILDIGILVFSCGPH